VGLFALAEELANIGNPKATICERSLSSIEETGGSARGRDERKILFYIVFRYRGRVASVQL